MTLAARSDSGDASVPRSVRGQSAGHDGNEILYASGTTIVSRATCDGLGTAIVKRALTAGAAARLKQELEVLLHLRDVAGVTKLVSSAGAISRDLIRDMAQLRIVSNV